MTISISEQAYDELLHYMSAVEPTLQIDPQDAQDFMGKFPPVLGQGYWRTIKLRDGLEVTLGNLQMRDCVKSGHQEMAQEYLELHLHLSGVHENDGDVVGANQYCFSGSGLMPKASFEIFPKQPFLEVLIFIRQDLLRSFIGDVDGELPLALQPWVRPVEQPIYSHLGKATAAMQLVARQMLRCQFQGMPKRMFLEGKSLELLGLVVAQEMSRHENNRCFAPSNVRDRIHLARDILQEKLAQPPSLAELARLVGLNECTLKREFRQVFDTTVFGYLYKHRMKEAWQLLETGEWKVEEVAQMTGYQDASAFGRAFRKHFGMKPRDCSRKFSV